MNKITAIIIDDEVHCQETLQWELEMNCPQVELLDKCSSAFEGIHSIQKHSPDVIFLDIEMPKMNGFEMLKEVQPMKSKVIFTTAYSQFALKAFRVSALDYLVKPIDGTELNAAVNKVESNIPPEQTNAQIDLLLEHISRKETPTRVALPTGEGMEIVRPEEIVKCEADSNYSTLFFVSGRKLVISRTLKEVEELFSNCGFLRVHQSHLVNLAFVRKYFKGDGGYLVLDDGSHLNVSRSRKDDLLKALGALK